MSKLVYFLHLAFIAIGCSIIEYSTNVQHLGSGLYFTVFPIYVALAEREK